MITLVANRLPNFDCNPSVKVVSYHLNCALSNTIRATQLYFDGKCAHVFRQDCLQSLKSLKLSLGRHTFVLPLAATMSFTLKTKDFRERSFTLCVLSSKRFAWLVALKQENPHVTRNVRVCKVLYKWGLCEGNRTRNQDQKLVLKINLRLIWNN